ncbi:MAG: hypothetical protein ABI972_01170 [Acidobacteriota bacterium]
MTRRIIMVASLGLAAAIESLACMCASFPDSSESFARAELVFAGRVSAVESSRLLPFSIHPAEDVREKYGYSVPGWWKLMETDTPAAVAIQKEALLAVAVPKYQARIEGIRTHAEYLALFEELMAEEVRAEFVVEEQWKGDAAEKVDIWQRASSCAIDFSKGERFLIYATRRAGRLTAAPCGLTKEVSSAGDDLAYLYFIKHSPAAAVRVWGYVGLEEREDEPKFLGNGVLHPVEWVQVRLESKDSVRRTDFSSSSGRFTIDGLEEGEYTMNVYDQPGTVLEKRIAGPTPVTIPSRGFVKRNIYIPTGQLKKP